MFTVSALVQIIAPRTWNYGLLILWPGGHGMVYDNAWRGMAWYVDMIM